MLRVINPQDIYYSLTDVVTWLRNEGVLTEKQGQWFTRRIYRYITAELAQAYNCNTVFSHLVPVILPFSDYFINWIVWANLLMLLPGTSGKHPKVHELNMLLDDAESLEKYPDLFENIELILLTKQGE